MFFDKRTLVFLKKGSLGKKIAYICKYVFRIHIQPKSRMLAEKKFDSKILHKDIF